MATKPRAVKESPLYQGEHEVIAYVLDTGPWGGSPTSPSVKIYDSGGTDQSSTCLGGSPSVSGDDITTPLVQSLAAGESYHLSIQWVNAGNTLEAYCRIYAEE
jgi:hypothetical protein